MHAIPSLLSLAPLLLLPAAVGGPAAASPLPHHPHDIISAVAFSPDYPADPRLFVASPGTINLFLVSEDHAYTWRPTRSGVRGQAFREIALASDWSRSGVAFVLTEDGGLQRSDDFGRTWGAPLSSERLQLLCAANVQADGARPLLVATEQAVLLSQDGGQAFRTVLRSPGPKVESIALSPTVERDGAIFVGLADGALMQSRDLGKTWRSVRLPQKATHIEPSVAFADDGLLWTATWGAGVLRSEDGGATFAPCAVGLSDLEVNEVRAARNGAGHDLFCCTRNDGVFFSMDGGKGWTHTPLAVEKTTQTTNHYTSIRMSPSWPEDKTVLCGTFEGLNVSRDGGVTWRESNVNPPRIGRLLDVSPTFGRDRTVFACGYGMHLLVSENSADSWDVRFTGMDAGSVYDIAPAPDFDQSKLVMLGVYKGVRRSTDGGATWQKVQFPAYDGEPKDGYTARAITYAPGYPQDRRVFTIGTRGMFFVSEDLGQSWQKTGVVTDWATAIEVSPDFENDRTIYVAGSHVWRSTDAGRSWEGPLHQGTAPADGLLLAPDFAETGEIYGLFAYQGFVIGKDRGASWEPHNEGLMGFSPSAIRLSPNFAQDRTIFLLTSGGGLFWSRDRGRSWERISELGGPVDQGFSLGISPSFADDRTLFVGAFDGFWRSQDGGRNWTATTSRELYDEKRDPWRRMGEWQMRWGGAPVNNTVTVSKRKGDRMAIVFEGIGCRLIGPRGPLYGTARIWLDGEPVVQFDQFAESDLHQQTMFEIGGLEAKSHELAVEVTGEGDPRSKGLFVGVDALEVVFR